MKLGSISSFFFIFSLLACKEIRKSDSEDPPADVPAKVSFTIVDDPQDLSDGADDLFQITITAVDDVYPVEDIFVRVAYFNGQYEMEKVINDVNGNGNLDAGDTIDVVEGQNLLGSGDSGAPWKVLIFQGQTDATYLGENTWTSTD